MIAEIEQPRAELNVLCRRFRVRRLDLFGSAAAGEFRSAVIAGGPKELGYEA